MFFHNPHFHYFTQVQQTLIFCCTTVVPEALLFYQPGLLPEALSLAVTRLMKEETFGIGRNN